MNASKRLPTLSTYPQATRIAVSTGIAGVVFTLSFIYLVESDELARDFTWVWRGAQVLMAGDNPYIDPRLDASNPYPWNAPLYYPLPAIILGIPLALLSTPFAGALFIGFSSGLLAWAATADGWHRLLVFTSPCFLLAVQSNQWTPLILALALLPGFAPISALLKPNLGIIVGLVYGTWRGWLIACLIGAATLLILPTWPFDWLNNASEGRHTPPFLIFPMGPFLLLALLAWRSREAWALLMFAFVPQRLIFYDQLILFALIRGFRAHLAVTAAMWLGYIGWRVTTGGLESRVRVDDLIGPWVVASTFFPVLVVILWNTEPVQLGWHFVQRAVSWRRDSHPLRKREG